MPPLDNPAQLGNYDFALKLAKLLSSKLDDQKSNLFFSPASISLVLGMCQRGAKGQTKRQMEETIFGTDSKQEDISKWIMETLKLESESENNEFYNLKFAHRIYANENFRVKKEFVTEMIQKFKSDALNVNFAKNGDKTADEINHWVEEVTNHRIKDLVPQGLLTAETCMLLVNALYFKGVWDDEFQVENTKKKNFYSSPNHTVEVEMMHMKEEKMYYENEQVQMLSLNYGASSADMLIILPREKFGLKNVMNQLTGSTLRQWIHGLSKKEVHIQVPKFKIEQSFQLNETLIKLGLILPFTDAADFLAMVEGSMVKISDVVHKAFIEVDEKGTEAAAATYMKIVPCCLSISDEEPKIFTADHPFLFILQAGGYEHEATILFMGEFRSSNDKSEKRDHDE